MTYIIDTRNTGGEALILGRHLTLPISSDEEIARQGSVRYNPVEKCLQIAVDTEQSQSPVEWATIKPSGDTFTGDGGEMRGDIEMVQGARLLLSIGSVGTPSLSFMADTKTGIAMLGMSTMSLIANGVSVATIAQSSMTVTGSVAATTGSFGTLTSPTANLISVDASMATINSAEIDDLVVANAEAASLLATTLTANTAEIWTGNVRTLNANTLVSNAATLLAATIEDLTINDTITANHGIFHEFSVVPDAGSGSTLPTILLGESAEDDWIIQNYVGDLQFAYQGNLIAKLTPTSLESTRLRALNSIKLGASFGMSTPSATSMAITFNDVPVATVSSTGYATFAGVETQELKVGKRAIAHQFLADDDNYTMGTVMVLGGTAEVTPCTTDASTAVVGVIAEPDTAVLIGDGAPAPATVWIVSSGRVMVKAIGPISRGTPLMSAVTPGFAVVAPNGTPAAAILGTAVADLVASGPGQVEIFMK